ALLRLKPRPDGVFCYNDPTAMGAMTAILEDGLRIPEDVAIIGCGNVHYASVLRVPLSSIDQRCELLGADAAKLALALIEGNHEGCPPKTILLEPTLVARASSLRNAALHAAH
ncbi:MAG: substrate-binding domain-containing protein, partial [Bryobacteraceae bacterium]